MANREASTAVLEQIDCVRRRHRNTDGKQQQQQQQWNRRWTAYGSREWSRSANARSDDVSEWDEVKEGGGSEMMRKRSDRTAPTVD
jgi:hypothetical protein